MKHSLEQANDLALRFYAAAQQPELLPAFINALAVQFDAHIVGLRIHDAGYASYQYRQSVGWSTTEWNAFDAATFEQNLWRWQAVSDLLQHGVGHDRTIVPERELIKSEWYRQLQQGDIDAGMGICLWGHSAQQLVSISINRSRAPGAFGEDDIVFAKRLLPHFRSAYAIMRRLSWAESKTQTLASAAERLNVGVALLSGTSRCLYRNEVAERLVAEGKDVTAARNETLRCVDSNTQRLFQTAVELAATGRLITPARIPIHDKSGTVVLVVVVSMLRGEVFSAACDNHARVAVFLHQPPPVSATLDERLRETYSLTRAEARLATLIASGERLANCTETLNVSIATVRTQLRSVFAKTRTNRQAELVRLLDFVRRSV